MAWLACIVYSTIPAFWLTIHPYANYWRSREHHPYRILVPLWMAMWIGMGALTWRWRKVSFYDEPWAWLPAATFFALGLIIYSKALQNFSGSQLGGVPEVVAGHHSQRLIITGIRNRVRHPVYLGHLCEMLAWSVGTGLVVNYGLTILAIVTGAIMIRMEDNELERRFGEEFRAYRRRVPSVLPRWRATADDLASGSSRPL